MAETLEERMRRVTREEKAASVPWKQVASGPLEARMLRETAKEQYPHLNDAQIDQLFKNEAMGRREESFLGEIQEPKGFWKTLGGDLMMIPTPRTWAQSVQEAAKSKPGGPTPGEVVRAIPKPLTWAQSVQEAAEGKSGQFGKGIVAASAEQAEKARQSEKMARELWEHGRYGASALAGVETFGRDVAAGLPILGPMGAATAEELSGGDPGAGFAHMAELFGPELLKLLPTAKVGPFIKKFPMHPKVKWALEAFEQAPQGYDPLTGLPRPKGQLSEGQRLGSQRLQKVERSLVNFPGSERDATEFYLKQREDLPRWGRSLFGRVGGATADEVAAGENLERRLLQRIKAGKQFADRSYDSIRQQTARFKKTVQTGTKQVPGPRPQATLTPAGMPQTVPVFSVLETPVELGPMRKTLQPLYDDLLSLMPEGRRAHSPAWRVLEELMTGKQTVMEAMDFDRSLGAIKALLRDGDSPYLTTRSQRVAKQVIGAGEKQLSDALRQVSPNIEQQLDRARKAVRTYHETAELMADLGQEPVGMYKAMTAAKDANYRLLTQVYREAPKEVEVIARRYLEGYLEAATKEGGLAAEGMMAGWKNLGRRTKLLMYGAQRVEDLDNFFLATKVLNPAEGSATAGRLAAFLPFGFAGEFLRELLTGHPVLAAGTAVGYVATEHIAPKIMARMLFTPGGAKALTNAITLSPGSRGFIESVRAVQAAAALAKKQEDQQAGGMSKEAQDYVNSRSGAVQK